MEVRKLCTPFSLPLSFEREYVELVERVRVAQVHHEAATVESRPPFVGHVFYQRPLFKHDPVALFVCESMLGEKKVQQRTSSFNSNYYTPHSETCRSRRFARCQSREQGPSAAICALADVAASASTSEEDEISDASFDDEDVLPEDNPTSAVQLAHITLALNRENQWKCDETATTHRSSRRISWEDRLIALTVYKAQHGHLRIPQGFSSKDSPGSTGLGKWACRQRKKSNRMRPRRRATLDEMGFAWSLRRGISWEDRIIALKRFFAVEGHMRVPYTFSGTGVGERRLGEWVSDQRKKHFKMSAERREELDNLGFIWRVHKRRVTAKNVEGLPKDRLEKKPKRAHSHPE